MKTLLLIFCACLCSCAFAADGPMKIKIKPLPGLRYDTKAFYVKPGTAVELTFENTDMMLHNLVIVKPGKRMEVVNLSAEMGLEGSEKHYVPNSPHVLFHTPVVDQNTSYTLKFQAPAEEANYPYVCTYPGHGTIMFGTMIVTNKPKPKEMNPVEIETPHVHHMGTLKVPTVRRLFLPDTGPASIAVALKNKLSYCWDAGACRFRYAWQGGFIKDIEKFPSELPKEAAPLEGTVIYTEEIFPWQVGNNTKPQWEFLGYKLDKEGYPEFHYKVDEAEIRERVAIDGTQITRSFQVTSPSNIKFYFDNKLADQIKSSGKKGSDHFEFTPEQAKDISISIKYK